MSTPTVRFFTFSAYHNKEPVAGSTHIRVNQLIKYWNEAELYEYGENPDALIFQKVYASQDYKFPIHFENKKILDICDPDWLSTQPIVETARAMDAITCPTETIAQFMRQVTDAPVYVVPDRFDIELLPKPKEHTKKAKTVVWFGYSHNADVLKNAMPLIDELKLNLIVISNNDPIAYRWSTRKAEKTWYSYIPYQEDTIYTDIQKADLALLPTNVRPIDRFKSNNRTIKAILAGLPVATTAKEVKHYLNLANRKEYLDNNYDIIKEEYDVRKSVEQMKQIIGKIR